MSDGAAALVVAGRDAVHDLKLHPLVRLVGWKTVGCDPSIMGIGPVDAIRGLLKQHKLTLDDINLIEVNLLEVLIYLSFRSTKLLPPKFSLSRRSLNSIATN